MGALVVQSNEQTEPVVQLKLYDDQDVGDFIQGLHDNGEIVFRITNQGLFRSGDSSPVLSVSGRMQVNLDAEGRADIAFNRTMATTPAVFVQYIGVAGREVATVALLAADPDGFTAQLFDSAGVAAVGWTAVRLDYIAQVPWA